MLPEFAFLPAVWVQQVPNDLLWAETIDRFSEFADRCSELSCTWVIGAGPGLNSGVRRNQGFVLSPRGEFLPLRNKAYLPNFMGSWEANWFARGEETFPVMTAGPLCFGLNICSELWALDKICRYPSLGANAVIAPRATSSATTDRWINLAKTVAVRTGTFCISSNRRDRDGECGGVGWIIGPRGEELARTSEFEPFVTRDLDLSVCLTVKSEYPVSLFE